MEKTFDTTHGKKDSKYFKKTVNHRQHAQKVEIEDINNDVIYL